MWPVVQLLCPKACALPEDIRVRQSSHTGGYVYWCTASKVETAELGDPPIWIPRPTCDWVVDDGAPYEHEDYGRQHTTSFGDGANG